MQKLSVDRHDQIPSGAIVSMLAEVNALPGSEIQPVVGEGHRDGGSQYRGLQVGGHVVTTFIVVQVVLVSFRDHPVEMRLKVGSDCGIRIFVDCQAR